MRNEYLTMTFIFEEKNVRSSANVREQKIWKITFYFFFSFLSEQYYI